jgi:steroid delta-isomerase
MPASPERIREVVERYVARVATGTTAEIMELFADGATVEDPVGSEVRSTPEAIREFYAPLESLEQAGEVLSVRVAAGEAAFLFELRTQAGDQTYTLAPIDVMTFDDDGRITSMRAYWSDADLAVS